MDFKTFNYKNLKWYIIKETNKEKLLLLKECMNKELIGKYFTNKYMVHKDSDVRFNENYREMWWGYSYIREILNGPFLDDLNKDELNIMRTTLKLNNEEKATEDYVRLLTVEEAKKLPKEILQVGREFGYWTMSPYYSNSGMKGLISVRGSGFPGYLISNGAISRRGVRPVISLKSNNLITDIDGNEIDLLEEMKRVIKL